MKKIISLFLVFCMVLSVSTLTYAADIDDEFISVANHDFTKGTGTWGPSTNSSGMHYDDGDRNPHVGQCVFDGGGTAEIAYSLPSDGMYELQWFYSGWQNDMGRVTLTFESAEGTQTTPAIINSSKTAGFYTVGTYVMNGGDGVINFLSDGPARFSALKFIYKGSVLILSSDKYSVDKVNNIISDIPNGTTAGELLENITYSNQSEVEVTDITGNVKADDEKIEDGDRLVIDGENELYLKTFTGGVIYSDNFNYRDFDEYKKINDALNTSANANKYMKALKADVEFSEYNGSNAMQMIPKGVGNATYEMNFIGFAPQTGKTVVEYDVAQKNFNGKMIWSYVSGLYTGVTATTDAGFALWGANISGRGTLMRDSANSARWISADGRNKLIMTSEHGYYHVVQVLDFAGNIETYVDGANARIADEQISADKSKSMSGFGGIKSIGLGAYIENSVDYNSFSDAALIWDNVKVYNPVEYAEYFIDLLPDTDETGDAALLSVIQNARDVVDEMTALGIDESEISNIDKLEYWEGQIGSVPLSSDFYIIDNENNQILNVVDGESTESFISHLVIPQSCQYSLETAEDGVIATGDILKVTDMFGLEVEFTIIADKKALINGYRVENGTVFDIPYATTVEEFLQSVVTARGAEAKVYTGDTLNNTVVLDGDILRVDEEEYILSVVPASGENTLSSLVYSIDNDNNTIYDILYGTSFTDFKASVTAPEFATVAYPYEDDYSGAVNNGDEITVIAQNGETKTYTLVVDAGSRTSMLMAKPGSSLIVDGEHMVVSNIPRKTTVAQLLDSLTATNNGTVKVYSEQHTQKVSGTINGTETVRVYPQDAEAGKECDIYSLALALEEISVQDMIVTVEEPGFTTDTGTISTSSATWTGYNKIVTRFVTNGLGIFNFTVPDSGNYKLYVYLSCQSLTQAGRFAVVKNGTELTGQSVNIQQQPEGWFDLGSFDFETGDEVQITSSTTSGFVRLTAARMAMSKMVTLETKAINNSGEVILNEGQNTINKSNLVFELSTEAVISEDNVSLVSENGNSIAFNFEKTNGGYTVSPKYILNDDNTYYLNVTSDALSKTYSYIIKGFENKIDASAQIVFYTADGKRAASAENAVRAKVNMKVSVNSASESETAKAIICYYPTNGTMDGMKEFDIDLSQINTFSVDEEILINTQSAEGNVKVFIWSEELIPVTGVYCK